MNMNLMFDKLSMSQWVRYDDTMLTGFNYRRADCSTRGHVSIFALCSGYWTRTLSHAVNIIKSVDSRYKLNPFSATATSRCLMNNHVKLLRIRHWQIHCHHSSLEMTFKHPEPSLVTQKLSPIDISNNLLCNSVLIFKAYLNDVCLANANILTIE